MYTCAWVCVSSKARIYAVIKRIITLDFASSAVCVVHTVVVIAFAVVARVGAFRRIARILLVVVVVVVVVKQREFLIRGKRADSSTICTNWYNHFAIYSKYCEYVTFLY